MLRLVQSKWFLKTTQLKSIYSRSRVIAQSWALQLKILASCGRTGRALGCECQMCGVQACGLGGIEHRASTAFAVENTLWQHCRVVWDGDGDNSTAPPPSCVRLCLHPSSPPYHHILLFSVHLPSTASVNFCKTIVSELHLEACQWYPVTAVKEPLT